MFSLIPIAHAATVGTLVKKVSELILNPLIIFMFVLALLYFLYGVYEFISNADSDKGRATGKQHIIWGLVGMAIMMSVFGIMNLLINTLGVTGVDVNEGTVDSSNF
ncbi:MAG: hypothetical protein WC795_01750 [Candidatus Paceibacterota bacterium]|jgi:hypothetical protein